jgi:hypothetical protein
MKHASEKQLVLLHYGDAADTGVDRHVAGCPECGARLESLGRLLRSVELPVPEKDAGYGADVWRRLAPRLEQPRPAPLVRGAFFASRSPRLAIVALAATVLVAAFLAGRFWQQAEQAADPISGGARERVLQLAVGDHLERSQTMLLELVNSSPEELGAMPDLSRAEELITTNRLYRQTASRSGDAGVADVLEQLERVLLEIARSPAPLSAEEQESLRKRIEGQGLLFKVRVLSSRLREQERPPDVADVHRERKRT